MLNIYQEFVRNHQYSLQILAHCKQNRDFDKLLKHYEAKPDCEERTLETFLTYPMFQVTAGAGVGPRGCHHSAVGWGGLSGAKPSPTAGVGWWGGKARVKMAWGWTLHGPTLLPGPAQAVAGLVGAAGGLSLGEAAGFPVPPRHWDPGGAQQCPGHNPAPFPSALSFSTKSLEAQGAHTA